MIKFNRDIINEELILKSKKQILDYIYNCPQINGIHYLKGNGFIQTGLIIYNTQVQDIDQLLRCTIKSVIYPILMNTSIAYHNIEWFAKFDMNRNKISVTIMKRLIQPLQLKRKVKIGEDVYIIEVNAIPSQFLAYENQNTDTCITKQIFLNCLKKIYEKNEEQPRDVIQFISLYLYGKSSIISKEELFDIQFSEDHVIITYKNKKPEYKRKDIHVDYIIGDNKYIIFDGARFPEQFVVFNKYKPLFTNIIDMESFLQYIQDKSDEQINRAVNWHTVRNILSSYLFPKMFGVNFYPYNNNYIKYKYRI